MGIASRRLMGLLALVVCLGVGLWARLGTTSRRSSTADRGGVLAVEQEPSAKLSTRVAEEPSVGASVPGRTPLPDTLDREVQASLFVLALSEVEVKEDGGTCRVLDSGWRKWGVAEGLAAGNYLVRPGVGPLYFATEKDLLAGRGARLPTQGARVDVVFDPPLPVDVARRHVFNLEPGEPAARLREDWRGATLVQSLSLPLGLEPVAVAEVDRTLTDPLRITDLHAGLRYELSIEGKQHSAGLKGSQIEAGKVGFVPPAKLIVPWLRTPGVEVVVTGAGTCRGKIYARPWDLSLGSSPWCFVENSRGWTETSRERDGTYEIWGAGFDWVACPPYPVVSIRGGQPDVSRVELHAKRDGRTLVSFANPTKSLVGRGHGRRSHLSLSPSVDYLTQDGRLLSYPTVPSKANHDLGIVRWKGNQFAIWDLRTPVEVVLFAPTLGATRQLTVMPGEGVEVPWIEPAVVRVFEEARRQALNWKAENPSGGRASLEMSIELEGHASVWRTMTSFHLGLEGYFDSEEWIFPLQDDVAYRLRIHPEGGDTVYLNIERARAARSLSAVETGMSGWERTSLRRDRAKRSACAENSPTCSGRRTLVRTIADHRLNERLGLAVGAWAAG